MFRDRTDAGAQLAARLGRLRGQDVLILAIPRGGVPVGAEIARQLSAELDVVVAHKLGARYEPELAIGAITASGGIYLNEEMLREEPDVAPEDFLRAEIARELAEARRRQGRLRGTRPPPRIAGRTIVLTDDGLATGATMRAAIRSVRESHPEQLIVAVPVAPPVTCVSLRDEADEVIAVLEPEPFLAVGVHYADFTPTDEREIQSLLQTNWTAQ